MIVIILTQLLPETSGMLRGLEREAATRHFARFIQAGPVRCAVLCRPGRTTDAAGRYSERHLTLYPSLAASEAPSDAAARRPYLRHPFE